MWRWGVQIADGVITKSIEQVNRGEILETVAQVRSEELIADRDGLGRWALSVPIEDWVMLRNKYPDLASKDAQISSRAWMKFIQSDESKPYRMRGRI